MGHTGTVSPHPKNRPSPSKDFLARLPDGTVRLRIRFDGAEAAMYEEAAGSEPIMDWFHRTLQEAARADIARHRASRPQPPKPPGAPEPGA